MDLILQLPIILMGTIFTIIALTTWRDSEASIKRAFFFLSMATAWLCFTYIFELNSTTLELKLFFNALQYLSFVSICPILLVFILGYVGRQDLVSRKYVTLLFLFPIATLFVLWTNGYHHLFYSATEVVSGNGGYELALTYGPLYWVYFLYIYSIFLVILILAIRFYLTSRTRSEDQTIWLVIGILVPGAVGFLQLTGLFPVDMSYSVIIGYGLAGLIITLVAFRVELMVMLPSISRNIVENMSDIAIATDHRGRIVRANPAGERVLGKDNKSLVGMDIKNVAPWITDVNGTSKTAIDTEVELDVGGSQEVFSIQSIPLRARGISIGSLYVLSNITAQVKSRRELNLVNTKLNMISSITRHDIMNQLMVINGYTQLLNEMLKSSSQEEPPLNEIIRSVKATEHLIEFAKVYQGMGQQAPSWQSVDAILNSAKIVLPADNVQVEMHTENIEIFGDRMLERTFYHLFDNSVQHGGHTTRIVVYGRIEGDRLIIVIEDNGEGIPIPDKERIFSWGYGKNTGLGLPMCRQILSMNRLSIRETGIPGRGARFEIVAEPGVWRRA